MRVRGSGDYKGEDVVREGMIAMYFTSKRKRGEELRPGVPCENLDLGRGCEIYILLGSMCLVCIDMGHKRDR